VIMGWCMGRGSCLEGEVVVFFGWVGSIAPYDHRPECRMWSLSQGEGRSILHRYHQVVVCILPRHLCYPISISIVYRFLVGPQSLTRLRARLRTTQKIMILLAGFHCMCLCTGK